MAIRRSTEAPRCSRASRVGKSRVDEAQKRPRSLSVAIRSDLAHSLVVEWQSLIQVDPSLQGGKPVLFGTRVPVEVVVGAIAAGDDLAEVARAYRLTDAQVRAALAYAAYVVASERAFALPA